MKKIAYYGPDRPPQTIPAGSVLLLRHADRTPIVDQKLAHFADITETGRQRSFAYGRTLAAHCVIERTFSSPVDRSIHTAEEIAAGYASMGRYLPQQEQVGTLSFDFEQWQLPGIPRRMLDDPYLEYLCLPAQKVERQKIVETFLKNMPSHRQSGSVFVAVSHDSLIILIATVMLGLENTTIADRPEFLEGILISPQGICPPE